MSQLAEDRAGHKTSWSFVCSADGRLSESCCFESWHWLARDVQAGRQNMAMIDLAARAELLAPLSGLRPAHHAFETGFA